MRIAGIQQGQLGVAAGRPTLPNKAADKQLCPASPNMGGSASVLHLDASAHGVVTSPFLPLEQ